MKTVEEKGMCYIYCPGCKQIHGLNVGLENSPKWQWNGSMDAPTFSPSLLARYTHPKGYSNENPAPLGYDGEFVTDVCHSFINNGQIQYLQDSTHKFSGQTIELPDVAEHVFL